MDWLKYQEAFVADSLSTGHDQSYIDRCLSYAARIHKNELPIIYSQHHLAALVGFDQSYLRFAVFSQDRFYRRFTIPKRSGGAREIAEPLPNLKKIQRWILDNILYRIPPSPYAKAFVSGRSIKENARFHRRQKMVLTLDVRDFFPSLSIKLVNRFFSSCGYSKKVAYNLTRLCTLNGGLPQGASTSPALANILFKKLDLRIAEYCKSKAVRYTRYADDLTFSGSFAEGELIRRVKKELKTLNLELKDSKTRLMLGHQRQEVTGIVVNNKLQVPRELRRNLRQAIFYIEKYGLENHLTKLRELRANFVAHLAGQANFVLFVNPMDRDALKALKVLKNYNGVDLAIPPEE